MGNCNSESEIKQKCTGCGYKKCDCTAGLDRICGRCDPSWKYNIPGTYDAQYEAWLRANPRPVKPVFDPQPALNSMDFVCTQCVQCQDFSGITAGGALDIKDPSQVMSCIGKMQDKQAADIEAAKAKAAADKAAADKAAADQLAADKAAADKAAADKAAADKAAAESKSMMIMFVIMFIVLLVVVGVVAAIYTIKGGVDVKVV